jgi:hypothetical protein
VKLKLYLEWTNTKDPKAATTPWKTWSGALALIAVAVGALARHFG